MNEYSCPHCHLRFSDPALPPQTCPSCGGALDNGGSGGPLSLISDYFGKVWAIMTRPRAFFRAMPLSGGVAGPLAFALVTHWMGSAASLLWRLLAGGALEGYYRQFMQLAGDVAEIDNPGRNAQITQMSDRITHWALGTGSVLVDPFLTLVQILFVSFLVFIGARILVTPGKDGAPREITFESALRVVCYGMTPAILAVLPVFGTPISYLYQVAVTVIGAREAYRISGTRAMAVAFFPQILLLAIVFSTLAALAMAVFKFFAAAFL